MPAHGTPAREPAAGLPAPGPGLSPGAQRGKEIRNTSEQHQNPFWLAVIHAFLLLTV